MTKRLYLDHPDMLRASARIERVGRDDRGLWLSFDQTVFHPQGGGQPSDAGVLRFHEGIDFPLIAATWSPSGDGVIQHYLAEASLADVAEGLTVELEVTAAQRHLHASLHTAGHLLAAVGEALVPGCQAVKGHHFPRECYIEFAGPRADLERLASEQFALLRLANEAISSDTPVLASWSDDRHRSIIIGDFSAMGCGGTHLSSLGALGSLLLQGIRIKSSRLRISYSLAVA